jgi:hypothetical protein
MKLIKFVILVILLCLVEFVGDINFKFYARNNTNLNLIVGLFAYSVLIFILIKLFKHSNLIFTNGMWDGISSIISVLLAYFLFHERLNNKFQWLGLLLTIVGTVLLTVGKIPK